MYTILIPLLTFGAVVAAIAGGYSIFSDLYLRDRSRVSNRIDDEFRRRQRDRATKSLVFKNVNQLAMDASGEMEAEPTFHQSLEILIEQADLQITVRKLLTLCGAFAVVLGASGYLIRQGALVGVVSALVGGYLPLFYVRRRRKARLAKLLSQMPEAFDLMSRVVRAGQTMSQSLQAVADEFPQPIAAEFSYCYEQQNLGLSPEVALRDLSRRTGLLEIKIFVTAVLVQQQTGGSLAEMLEKLSNVIRLRYRIRGQIDTLTAEGRLQAIILLGLPIVMFFGFLIVMPEYEGKLLEHPSLIYITLGCELMGALWIRKLVNFEY